MSQDTPHLAHPTGVLLKTPTGIQGLDEITFGGLPQGRTTLVCGGPGCGKTLFGVEFLVRGILQYGEPGVLMVFEETGEEVARNVASLGYDLPALIARNRLFVDFVQIERSEIEETGEYSLDGLFIRLADAVQRVGAKRVVLDTLEALFAGLPNEAIVRAELRRLFRWLKNQGVTAVMTAERGSGSLTRHGLEEYVSDCVIFLDHQLTDRISTRRLRVIKYRGTHHGTNEYPFLIDEQGFSVFPVTSLGLNHQASDERISTGLPELDAMLGSKGLFRGSSVLISGTAGTGKTSLAVQCSMAACQRGEAVLYFAFEESPSQIERNMRSINLDLAPCIKQETFRFHAARPTLYGLEMHLAIILKRVQQERPRLVVFDPISNLVATGSLLEVKIMLTRLIDYLKTQGVTALFTSLSDEGESSASTEVGVSSIMDTWISLRTLENNGERNRTLYVLKSRGTAHSNQIREFRLTGQGIELIQPYLGSDGVLTGTSRIIQESLDEALDMRKRQAAEMKRRALQRKRKLLESQMEALQAEIEAENEELKRFEAEVTTEAETVQTDRAARAESRR